MYIDIHAHVALNGIYPQQYLSGMLGDSVKGLPPDKISRLLAAFLSDGLCDNFAKQLDTAGVEKTVLLIIDGMGLGEAPMSLEQVYELHYKIIEKYPDKFIVFGGLDPRRENGLALFEKGVYEYGFRGLKLYPPMGFRLDDKRLEPVFDICRRERLPVLIHSGASLPALWNHNAEPETYTDTLRKYPGIPFILAHMGYRLNYPGIPQILELPNVSLDITGFQTLPAEQVSSMLAPAFEEKMNTKIVYGSDWPLFNLMRPMTYHIGLVKNAFEAVKHRVPADAFDNIMRNNAQRILSGK